MERKRGRGRMKRTKEKGRGRESTVEIGLDACREKLQPNTHENKSGKYLSLGRESKTEVRKIVILISHICLRMIFVAITIPGKTHSS